MNVTLSLHSPIKNTSFIILKARALMLQWFHVCCTFAESSKIIYLKIFNIKL